jgi:methylenetetrahydrofolate reductase (NADPH)
MMKVTEHLEKSSNPRISFEIIPPKRGGDIKALLSVIEDIAKYNPPFIDITSHAAEVIYEETPQGIQRKIKRKRPGTLGICALIQNKFNIDAVPHVLCQGFTKEETEDFLIELSYLGIQNVLAIRGDEKGYKKPLQHGRTANEYAIDLVKQIKNMNEGIYLERELLDAKPTDFCIGIAGYPEKHFESPNLLIDLKYTKEKADAGADYIVTQMFFDNAKFYNYLTMAREIGIQIPIIPGLKIITNKSHITNLPKNFYIDIPVDLAEEVIKAKKEHVIDIGVEYAARQVEDLFNNGIKLVHFYIMQDSTPVKKLMEKLKL